MIIKPKKNKESARRQRRREAYEAPGPVRQFPPTGRARYNADRFLADCLPETRDLLRAVWRKGNQLVSKRVPVDALPAVVILACYAKDYGANLVDDYQLLLDRYSEHIDEIFHNDKFFASCIVLLASRWQSPSEEAYASINVPGIYEELLG